MKNILFLFLFITTVSFGQIPAGIDPLSISQEDLDKYGITREQAAAQYKDTNVLPSDDEVIAAQAKDAEAEAVVMVNATRVLAPDETAVDEVYGKNLFEKNKLSVYQSATNVKASDNYVLGEGDEISVSIWGFSEHSSVYKVGADGSISPRLVGKIYLKSQNYANAKKIIAARFGKVYDLKNSQISIELNYSKVIRVNIVGEVLNPGTYSVPAINPVFNILSLAGGINENGTLRNIEIRRNGKIVEKLDVYDFMQNPSAHNDLFLQDNDYIMVGFAEKIVSIKGAVNRPAIYELKEKETISDLINYSGNLKPFAYTKRINLNRFQNNRNEIIEIDYDSLMQSKGKFSLENGDVITISAVPDELRNSVFIEGSVNIPGTFVLKKGMTVGDLVKLSEGLTVDAYEDRAYLQRRNADRTFTSIPVNLKKELTGGPGTKLQEFDKLTVYSKDYFLDKFNVTIDGAVRKPSSYTYTKGLKLGDLIFMAGGLLPEAAIQRIEVSRIADFNNSSGEKANIIINTYTVEEGLLSEKNNQIELMPNDVVTVRQVPEYQKQSTISIEGEVAFPGLYVIKNGGEKISELITRAGGITEWAFLEGAYLTKMNSADEFIVFDLKKLLKNGANEYDYSLQPGDRLVIPKLASFVMLSGAVEYPKVAEYGVIKIPFEKGKSAKKYINKYGSGFAKKAKRRKLYVESPGGKVKKTRNFLFFKIYPKVKVGDKIVVPFKNDKKEKEQKPPKDEIDWNRAIENTTVKLTGLATFYIILRSAGLFE